MEATRILGPVFEQFVNESPLSVMSRATLEYALPASFMDSLFERTAELGYTKELLFSTTVTLKCVYEKLQHLETPVSAAMVRAVAGRRQGLIRELGGECPPLLPGYRVRILDGNHLAATHVATSSWSGPVPASPRHLPEWWRGRFEIAGPRLSWR
jgi:hypothetical protein